MEGFCGGRWMLWIGLLCFFCLRATASVSSTSDETLLLQALSQEDVMATIRFGVVERVGSEHYSLFPKSLGQTMRRFAVRELHLSMTRGQWLYNQWGLPPLPSPLGAEMWAWLSRTRDTPEERDDVDERWRGLTHAMSGLLCSSLNRMDTRVTCTDTPQAFVPEAEAGCPGCAFRYGTLPRTSVCTSSLTPWLKVLPCRGKAGLGAFLDPYALAEAHYFSLSVDVWDDEEGVLHLDQTLTAVFRMHEKNSLTLSTLFRRPFPPPCPLAHQSTLRLDTGGSKPPPGFVLMDSWAVADLDVLYHANNTSDQVDLVPFLMEPIAQRVVETPSMKRQVAGSGNERGTLVTDIYSPSVVPSAVFYDIIPWFIQGYFHTLQIYVDGQRVTHADLPRVEFRPGLVRFEPSTLEIELSLPANSTTRISLDFDKCLLTLAEYPPDAHRGFDAPAAIMTLPVNRSTSALSSPFLIRRPPRIYSPSLLIVLPTPDFSMPYNVITLTSSVIAVFFGSLYNVLMRRSPAIQSSPTLFARLTSLLRHIRRRGKKEKES